LYLTRRGATGEPEKEKKNRHWGRHPKGGGKNWGTDCGKEFIPGRTASKELGKRAADRSKGWGTIRRAKRSKAPRCGRGSTGRATKGGMGATEKTASLEIGGKKGKIRGNEGGIWGRLKNRQDKHFGGSRNERVKKRKWRGSRRH